MAVFGLKTFGSSVYGAEIVTPQINTHSKSYIPNIKLSDNRTSFRVREKNTFKAQVNTSSSISLKNTSKTITLKISNSTIKIK